MSGMALDDDRVQAFLIDLLALTNRHRIGFDSCGCSGSPWLVELEDLARNVSVYKQGEHYDCLELNDEDPSKSAIVIERTDGKGAQATGGFLLEGGSVVLCGATVTAYCHKCGRGWEGHNLDASIGEVTNHIQSCEGTGEAK